MKNKNRISGRRCSLCIQSWPWPACHPGGDHCHRHGNIHGDFSAHVSKGYNCEVLSATLETQAMQHILILTTALPTFVSSPSSLAASYPSYP